MQLAGMKDAVAAMKRDLEARERSKAAAVERAMLLEKRVQELVSAAMKPAEAAAAAAALVDQLRRELREAREEGLALKAQAAYHMRKREQQQLEQARASHRKRQQQIDKHGVCSGHAWAGGRRVVRVVQQPPTAFDLPGWLTSTLHPSCRPGAACGHSSQHQSVAH
jgi:hypothetical protein